MLICSNMLRVLYQSMIHCNKYDMSREHLTKIIRGSILWYKLRCQKWNNDAYLRKRVKNILGFHLHLFVCWYYMDNGNTSDMNQCTIPRDTILLRHMMPHMTLACRIWHHRKDNPPKCLCHVVSMDKYHFQLL